MKGKVEANSAMKSAKKNRDYFWILVGTDSETNFDMDSDTDSDEMYFFLVYIYPRVYNRLSRKRSVGEGETLEGDWGALKRAGRASDGAREATGRFAVPMPVLLRRPPWRGGSSVWEEP